MQPFLNNRYSRLLMLGAGVSLLIYLLLWTVFAVFEWREFPAFLHVALSLLGGGLIVYKFLAGRVF